MEDFRKQREPITDEPAGSESAEGSVRDEPAYPSSIQKMSEKWRSIQQQEGSADQRGFFEKNFLALGIGIALLIIALIIVLGGFTFLVVHWR